MKLLARLLYRLTANRPCRLIEINGHPYLERYFIGQVLGITVYLHRFVRDDDERHLHNHPWNHALSVVLCGRYTETQADSTTHASICTCRENLIWLSQHQVRWVNYIHRNDFHQITGVKPETWTLFLHTRWKHRWGFLHRISRDIPLYEFQTYTSDRPREWWHTAPPGKHARRWPFGA